MIEQITSRVKRVCLGMVRGYVRRRKTAEVSRLGKYRHTKVTWFSQASTRKKSCNDMRPLGKNARASTAAPATVDLYRCD